MSTIPIADLVLFSYYPHLALRYLPQSVERYSIKPSSSEQSILRSTVSYLSNVGISSITHAVRYGCVYSLTVSIATGHEYPILLCDQMDLRDYYYIWRAYVSGDGIWNGWNYSMAGIADAYLDAMRSAIRSARTLSHGGLAFAIACMLDFRNDILRSMRMLPPAQRS